MARDKEKNAHARTMAPAYGPTVATFRNICGPYHTGARLSGRRYIPKYLHLARNGKSEELAAKLRVTNTGAQLAPQAGGHGLHLSSQHGLHHKLANTVSVTQHCAQLASQTTAHGKHHKLRRTSKGEEHPATSKGEELARAGKGNLRPTQVRVKNWRGPVGDPSTDTDTDHDQGADTDTYHDQALIRIRIMIKPRYGCGSGSGKNSLDTHLAGS